jgi:hypothetical protein
MNADQKLQFQIYEKSIVDTPLEDALKVAKGVFGKNFRLEETAGYIEWLSTRNCLIADYYKARDNINYAMKHQYKGNDDQDYYMSEEGILTENDDDGEMPEDDFDIKYFQNEHIERMTEIITEILEDEDLWDELDYNTKPIEDEAM